jgi:hypothetical protein
MALKRHRAGGAAREPAFTRQVKQIREYRRRDR